jgi:hypothetical protein
MRESIRAICVLVAVVAGCIACLAWGEDELEANHPFLLYGCPVIAVAAVGWFVFDSLRRDRAPDFLKKHFKSFFDGGGLGFVIVPCEDRGVCRFEVYFQNRYERPCRATVGLRPASGLFNSQPFFPPVFIEIDCPGGAFGHTSCPVGVPYEAAGQVIAFSVGARVVYPQGKGRILRYRDGITLRYDHNFHSTFVSVFQGLALLGGGLLFSRPAGTTMTIPYGVEEFVPIQARERTEIHWQPGDPEEPDENRESGSQSRRR